MANVVKKAEEKAKAEKIEGAKVDAVQISPSMGLSVLLILLKGTCQDVRRVADLSGSF